MVPTSQTEIILECSPSTSQCLGASRKTPKMFREKSRHVLIYQFPRGKVLCAHHWLRPQRPSSVPGAAGRRAFI